MKNLEIIQNLLKSSKSIQTLFNVLIPKWKQDEKHFDKTGAIFNQDERFSACKGATIYFSSWMGTYGDSGCSTQCRIDSELWQKHLVKYLNLNRKEVMLAIARQIEEDAIKLKADAEKELSEQLENLKKLQ